MMHLSGKHVCAYYTCLNRQTGGLGWAGGRVCVIFLSFSYSLVCPARFSPSIGNKCCTLLDRAEADVHVDRKAKLYDNSERRGMLQRSSLLPSATSAVHYWIEQKLTSTSTEKQNFMTILSGVACYKGVHYPERPTRRPESSMIVRVSKKTSYQVTVDEVEGLIPRRVVCKAGDHCIYVSIFAAAGKQRECCFIRNHCSQEN
jgi:hypothetical protein